jgi:hypothetical protein
LLAAGFGASAAPGRAFRVTTPQIELNAFAAAEEARGRSHAIAAWSRASTSPSSLTMTLFGP